MGSGGGDEEDAELKDMAHLCLVSQAVASIDPDVSEDSVSYWSQGDGGVVDLLCEHGTLLVKSWNC